MPSVERRRAGRYPLQLPIEITRIGRVPSAAVGVTQNISSRGVQFSSDLPFATGKTIEFKVKIQPGNGSEVVLYGAGNVVRVEVDPSGRCVVAATVERFEFLRAGAEASWEERAGSRPRPRGRRARSFRKSLVRRRKPPA